MTMAKQTEPKKRRRRNCLDRMRHALAERQRQKRGGDPATKVLLQLLAILSAGLAVLPPMPSFSFFSELRRPRSLPGVSSPPGGQVRRLPDENGFRPPVRSRESGFRPVRKVGLNHLDDEDRGPTAHAMERGIDPPYYMTSSHVAPTWSKLVKDLKRSRSKEKAAELLEYRVPPEAVEWLSNRIFMEDWWTLRQLARDCASDAEIAAAALVEAKKWEAAQPKQPEPEPITDPGTDGSGEPDSGTGLKP